MNQRVRVLARFLLGQVMRSLSGLIYVIGTLLFWYLFFPPTQQTPDPENYLLIVAVFGITLTFLVTLTVASRANQAHNYPLLVRLTSRVEYLTAVLLAALSLSFLLQLLLALLALINGPSFSTTQLLMIPPIWIAPNVLAAVLAMHASDFVTAGWSRVYVFGVLAIFLFGQNLNDSAGVWLGERLDTLSTALFEGGLLWLSDVVAEWSASLQAGGEVGIGRFFGFLFWPFRAIIDATVNGFFNPTQAFAPAVILLYATILFMLAADLFATKDLDFTE